MPDERSICVICAWRELCKKKFSMDGSTTTRCVDFTRDLTLKTSESVEESSNQNSTTSIRSEKE